MNIHFVKLNFLSDGAILNGLYEHLQIKTIQNKATSPSVMTQKAADCMSQVYCLLTSQPQPVTAPDPEDHPLPPMMIGVSEPTS